MRNRRFCPPTADDEDDDLPEMAFDGESYIEFGKALELARSQDSESERKKGRDEAVQRYQKLCPKAKRVKQCG